MQVLLLVSMSSLILGCLDRSPNSALVGRETTNAFQLTNEDCVDPDLTKLSASQTVTMCDGSTATGELEIDPAIIKSGEVVAGVEGTYVDPTPQPDPWDIRYGVQVGAVTGKLKLNCRNMASPGTLGLDNQGGLAVAGLDVWDTVDDFNDNSGDPPADNPWFDDIVTIAGTMTRPIRPGSEL